MSDTNETTGVVVPESLLRRIESALARLEASSHKVRRAYPLKEAARLLGMSLSSLKERLADGSVKFIRIGSGGRKVTDEEIRRVTSAKSKAKTMDVPAAREAGEEPPDINEELAKFDAIEAARKAAKRSR